MLDILEKILDFLKRFFDIFMGKERFGEAAEHDFYPEEAAE